MAQVIGSDQRRRPLALAAGLSIVLAACGPAQNALDTDDQGRLLDDLAAQPCGNFRLESRVEPPAGEEVLVVEELTPPYVATMGARVAPGEQVADVTLVWSSPPTEQLRLEINGHDLGDVWPPERLISLMRGAAGDYVVRFEGQASGCVTQFEMTYVLDTVLRASDEQRGLTEPPPPNEQFPFERWDP